MKTYFDAVQVDGEWFWIVEWQGQDMKAFQRSETRWNFCNLGDWSFL